MAKVVHASVLRNHLADALDEVETKEKFLLIARNGEMVSALVDLDFFEDLLSLRSQKYLKGIQEARRQFEKGDTFSHDEVFGKI